jgi:SAM-dependent methyltransferase
MKNNELEFTEEWNEVWSHSGFMAKIVNVARNFYNIFFERLLFNYVDSNTEMVELGCGTASLGFLISDKIESYCGIDISPIATQKAQARAKMESNDKMTFLLEDVRNLKEEYKNRYDFSWSTGLMEHFDDSFEVVKKHIEIVKIGGIVLISVPYKYSIHNLWYKITRIHRLKRFWPWTEQIFYSYKELSELGKQTKLPYRVFFLTPKILGFFLGMIILEIKKNEQIV